MPRIYNAPSLNDDEDLTGELRLIAAFLRRMVADARLAKPRTRGSGLRNSDPELARDFLLNFDLVRVWAEATGADAQVIQHRLLQEARIHETLENDEH